MKVSLALILAARLAGAAVADYWNSAEGQEQFRHGQSSGTSGGGGKSGGSCRSQCSVDAGKCRTSCKGGAKCANQCGKVESSCKAGC